MKTLMFLMISLLLLASPLRSSMAKSSSTIQIYQKSQTSPQYSNGSKSAKNSSETPTPTMSSQDVVRIYVPPADDMIPSKKPVYQRERGDDEISQSSNRSSIIQVEYETLPFERFTNRSDMSPIKSPSKTDQTSPGANKFQPQQYYYYPNPNQTIYQSSSSRRGSMTRKTPSPLLNELIVECDHMKIRRSQDNVNEDNSITYSVNGSTTTSNKIYQFNSTNNNNNNNNYSNNNNSSLKRLTSFEELAKKSESNSLLYIHETTVPESSFRQYSSTSTSKPKSDYNICYNYKNLDDELDTSKHQQQMIKKSTSHSYNIRRSDRKHSSSDNSPFDYDLLKEKRKDNRFMYDDDASDGRPLDNNDNSIKSYDRFFNSDDELEDDEIRHNRASKKSNSSGTHKYRSHISGTEADDDDENSSNSPTNNKSILNTPINETMPLLSNDAEANSSFHHSPAPPPVLPSSSNSLRQKSKIPRPNRGSSSNNNSIRKTSSVSSPDGSDRSDGYQTSINRFENQPAEQPVAYQSPAYRSGSNERPSGSSSQRSDNKIRIKINQKN